MVKKEWFLDLCEMWESRITALVDIYDGLVWSDFQTHGFLDSPFNYLVTLNFDWFQPFSHIEYSVGALYLCIQNQNL